MDQQLSKSLYRWAKNNPDNQELLETWLSQTITAIAAGNGAEVQSTSGNGIMVSFQTNKMSVMDWFKTISKALEYLEQGLPSNKIQGILR